LPSWKNKLLKILSSLINWEKNMQTSNRSTNLGELVYKNETTLFILHFAFATIFWLMLVVGTMGMALLYMLGLFIGYLFAQSALIAWIKGNGVRISADQFPDLHDRYTRCCQTLGLTPYPDAYLINGGGILNAFATRFLGRHFVVLYSNVVDALESSPEAINFYIGHELGHIQRKHLQWGPYIWPASILPLLGAAYSRSREYTCDQFGRACCNGPQPAVQGLVALAAGEKRWATLSVPAYLAQAEDTGGFWMSFHELVADYPWLVKRAARLDNPDYSSPMRNPLAWLIALFVPRFGVGGGMIGLLIMVAVIGILSAIAIPAYQDFANRAKQAQTPSAQISSPLDFSAQPPTQ
jgi:Zn-dependent protease with chaperone function